MSERYTASTITDDALDALYERLRKTEQRGEQAEASVARVRAVARMARGHGAPVNQDLWELAGAVLDATESGPKESTAP